MRRQFEQTQAIPILAGPGRWRWRSEVKLLTPEPIQSREKDSRNIEARLPIQWRSCLVSPGLWTRNNWNKQVRVNAIMSFLLYDLISQMFLPRSWRWTASPSPKRGLIWPSASLHWLLLIAVGLQRGRGRVCGKGEWLPDNQDGQLGRGGSLGEARLSWTWVTCNNSDLHSTGGVGKEMRKFWKGMVPPTALWSDSFHCI